MSECPDCGGRGWIDSGSGGTVYEKPCPNHDLYEASGEFLNAALEALTDAAIPNEIAARFRDAEQVLRAALSSPEDDRAQRGALRERAKKAEGALGIALELLAKCGVVFEHGCSAAVGVKLNRDVHAFVSAELADWKPQP